MLGGVPPDSARATSSALAARISSSRASSDVGHRLAARASFWARVARARPWLAARARSATASDLVLRVMRRA